MQSLFQGSQRSYNYFRLGDLFSVKGCSAKFTAEKAEQLGRGVYPYITTTASNNGMNGLFDSYRENGNVITIDSAAVGCAFYQRFPFLGSDHVEKLEPVTKNGAELWSLTEPIGLFICALLSKEMFRYSYGRKFNQDRIRETRLPLPLKHGVAPDPNGNKICDIDWAYIEGYVSNRIKKANTAIGEAVDALSKGKSASDFFNM